MNHDILALLQSRYRTFSKGQRMIAKYILESYDKAAFMTASALGKAVGISESTVVRFAMELGFDGYPGMQKVLQEMVRNRLTSVQRIEATNDRIGDHDVVSMILQEDINRIHRTAEAVDRQAFGDSVNAIVAAKRIYLIGVRSCAALASFWGMYLNYMFNNVQIIAASGAGEMFEKLVRVGPEDVVVAISFPRYSNSTIKAVRYCRSAGATIIAITDNAANPIGENANYVLLAKSDMVSMVDSLVAPMSLVNALIVAIASKRSKELTDTFTTLERVWDEYDIYKKTEN